MLVFPLVPYSCLLLICVVFLLPVLVMLLNSFKSDTEIYSNPSGLPIHWTLDSYANIFRYHEGMWRNYLNSVIVAVTSTAGALFICSLAAFAFSKYRFKGRRLLFTLLLATMMVPPELVIPGSYILFAKLNMINTLLVQALPTIPSVLGLFLIRQYMMDLPDSLIESARMDGAGHFMIYGGIIVPISSPVLGAYAILHFLTVWNTYTWPVLVATKKSVQPIMVLLPQLVDPIIGFIPVWGTIMAGCMLSTLPILGVFLGFQDKFMSSVVIGAIKE